MSGAFGDCSTMLEGAALLQCGFYSRRVPDQCKPTVKITTYFRYELNGRVNNFEYRKSWLKLPSFSVCVRTSKIPYNCISVLLTTPIPFSWTSFSRTIATRSLEYHCLFETDLILYVFCSYSNSVARCKFSSSIE